MPKAVNNMFKIFSKASLYYTARENNRAINKTNQTALESNAHRN